MADRTKDPIEGRARIMPQDQVGDGESEVEGHVMKGGRATPQDQSGQDEDETAGHIWRAALSRQRRVTTSETRPVVRAPTSRARRVTPSLRSKTMAIALSPAISPVRVRSRPRGTSWDEDSPPSRISKVPGGMQFPWWPHRGPSKC